MANSIKVTVVSKDGISLINCPVTMHLPCPDGTLIDGRDFFFNSDPLQQTWNFPPQTEEAGGSTASFPVAHVTVGGHDYYVIADLAGSPPTETVNQLVANACNECCEASPGGEPEVVATPDDIIPILQHMTAGFITQDCTDGTCTYDYFDTLPANGSGTTYSLQFSCAGQLYTSGGTTFTTIAGALAYAQANWGSVGTWSLNGNQLKVVGTSCAVGVLQHTNV